MKRCAGNLTLLLVALLVLMPVVAFGVMPDNGEVLWDALNNETKFNLQEEVTDVSRLVGETLTISMVVGKPSWLVPTTIDTITEASVTSGSATIGFPAGLDYALLIEHSDLAVSEGGVPVFDWGTLSR